MGDGLVYLQAQQKRMYLDGQLGSRFEVEYCCLSQRWDSLSRNVK